MYEALATKGYHAVVTFHVQSTEDYLGTYNSTTDHSRIFFLFQVKDYAPVLQYTGYPCMVLKMCFSINI